MRQYLLLRSFLALLAISCAAIFAACSESPAYLRGDADAKSPPPAACDIYKTDCDGDGVLYPADCVPFNSAVHPSTGLPVSEVCANGFDDNCDGATDSGTCVGNIQPPPVCAGTEVCCNGKDDDCNTTTSDMCGPCATQPPPTCGTIEICNNSLDDDCNAATSDVCGTQPPPTGGSPATFKVSKSSSGETWSFNVGWFQNKNQVPSAGWFKTVTNAVNLIELSLDQVPADLCGFRLNTVNAGNTNWLCLGNGASAQLNPDMSVTITYLGQTYSKANLKIWSEPNGNGCSAVLMLSSAEQCQIPLK